MTVEATFNRASEAEAQALQRLKDAVIVLGLPSGQSVALYAAANAYGHARAARMVLEDDTATATLERARRGGAVRALA